MTSANKLLAVAIVAMFVASGFIVICENVSVADENVGEVAIIKQDGSQQTFDGEWALNKAISEVTDGQYVKILKDYTGAAVRIDNGSSKFQVNIEGTPTDMSVTSLVIDFNGKTLTIDDTDQPARTTPAWMAFYVHSNFTKITLKSSVGKGTLAVADNEQYKLLFQNHATNCTLENMIMDGSNLIQSTIKGEPADTYTVSNYPAVAGGEYIFKDIQIISTKADLAAGTKHMSFDVDGKSGPMDLTLQGEVDVDGGICFWNDSPITIDDGAKLVMESGDIIMDGPTGEPTIILEGESSLDINGSVSIQLLGIQIGESGDRISLTGVDASNAEFASDDTKTTMTGIFTGDSTSEIELNTDIYIGDGLDIDLNGGKFVSNDNEIVGASTGSIIVFGEGTNVDGQTLTESVSYKVDDKGEATRVILIVFEVTEHVESITYEGKSYISVDYTEAGYELDLSKIEVVAEDGYGLTGFMVNGEEHGYYGTVTITGVTTITAIVEEGAHPVYPSSDDGKLAAIGAVMVFVILVALLALVFSKKTH